MKNNPISADFLKRHCQQSWSDIIVFDSIGSTSSWLKDQSAPHLVCLAEHQTAGRGRHGHHWQSPNAENIYLSFNWQFDQPIAHIGLLSLWVGVVLAEVLEKHGLHNHGIKWPNDIYWQQQKMGGILVEGSNLSSRLIVGIGLNVNMHESAGIDQPWTSMSEALQQTIDRNQFLVPLLDSLYSAMIEFPHLDEAEFMRRWNRWDLIRGYQVSFNDNANVLTGESRGVDKNGYLKVMLESGELRTFGTTINQVRWR